MSDNTADTRGPDWQITQAQADEALTLLRGGSAVLLPTHQNVDADGLASPLALALALDQLGIRAAPLISDGDFPRSLGFLPGIERVSVYGRDPLPDYDRLCLVDCSDRRRLGSFHTDDPVRVSGVVPTVNIDHHVTNDLFGQVNIVVPEAASAAEIVAEVLRLWGTTLTPEIAQCLLAGIYGDTLGLRTPATSARTIRTAADLVDAGADLTPIVDQLFRLKPRSTVCLWRRALDQVQWAGSVIWTELTEDIFRECGAAPAEAEGLVNFLAGTEGSRVAGILYANKQGWRVSLRSLVDDVDVAAIASVFGGGGHPRAAGVQIVGDQEAKNAFLNGVADLASGSTGSAGGRGGSV